MNSLSPLERRVLLAATPATPRADTLGTIFDKGERQDLLGRLTAIDSSVRITLQEKLAVSVGQYLPTLFAGGGRFVTVTTEAVSLSAGGNYRLMAVHALLQIVIPLAGFGLAAWLGWRVGLHRRGLRG